MLNTMNCMWHLNFSLLHLHKTKQSKIIFFIPPTSQEHSRVYNVGEDRRYQEIQCDLLSPGKVYVVDVQASVNPQLKNLDQTEWSKWSDSVECTCPHADPGAYILK